MLRKQAELTEEVIAKIKMFQSGEVTPIATHIPWLDDTMMGGLYPSDVLVIAALSGNGKTYLLEEIQRNIIENSKEDEYIFMQGQWEIESFKGIVRLLARESGNTPKEILLNKPTREDNIKYGKALAKLKQDNIYIQGEPVNVETFKKDVEGLIEKYPNKKLLISVDNLENILTEGVDQRVVLDSLMKVINILKKRHFYICFILLSQLNSNIESRTEPTTMFPRASDLFSSGSTFKLADTVLVKHLPYKLNITDYGLFPKDRYAYIKEDRDRFIKEGAGKNNKFIAKGNGFIHVLKARSVEESEDRQDLFPIKIY